MVSLRPLSQKRVDFVNKDDTRLSLPRKAEQASDQLVRLSVPLVRQHRCSDVDKCRSGFLGECFRKHGFPAPGWAEE